MAYETAALTGVGQYGLTYLRRGLYGTAVAAHPAGGQFARLDGNLFEFDPPAAYVGQTLFLKFTSINIYGAAEEDLSEVAVYSYVPTGKGGFIAAPSNLLISSADQLAAIIAGNQPILSDLFQNSADGWVMAGGSLTLNPASLTTLSTGTAPLLAKSGLTIAGSTYNQVFMVVRRKDAGTDWSGLVQWSTSGHGFSSANQAAVPAPTGFGSFQTLVWDLSANADWIAGTVTGLQFALSTAAGDSFEIQSIQVSKNVVQSLLLSGLQGQINSAQIAISGLQASITQTASATTVANNTAQISTLTTDVNALTGEISLKANQTDLTSLATSVTSAELLINSLQGQITENITSVTVPGADQGGEATLAALVDQAKQALAFTGAIASARQQLQAHSDNQTLAEAAQRLALSTQVNRHAPGAAVGRRLRRLRRHHGDEHRLRDRPQLHQQPQRQYRGLGRLPGGAVPGEQQRLAVRPVPGWPRRDARHRLPQRGLDRLVPAGRRHRRTRRAGRGTAARGRHGRRRASHARHRHDGAGPGRRSRLDQQRALGRAPDQRLDRHRRAPPSSPATARRASTSASMARTSPRTACSPRRAASSRDRTAWISRAR
jgi:hypothetical protein